MSTPLLPNLSSEPTDKWEGFAREGMHPLQPDDFESRLYSIENIHENGIPEVLAHPFAYSIKLRCYNFDPLTTNYNFDSDDPISFNFNDPFIQFSILIKAMFLGIIRPEPYPLDTLGSLGKIIETAYPDMTDFVALEWNGATIGGIYPECLVYPGIREVQSLIDIQFEIIKKENHYGQDNIKSSFMTWVQAVTALPTPPTWANRLLNMIGTGGTWDTTGIGPIAGGAGSHLGLIRAKVDPAGSHNLTLVRYTDHILTCNRSDGVTDVSLSDAAIALDLGSGGNVDCNNPNNNIPECKRCKDRGNGPIILEKGFFQDKNGGFIIWKDFENCPIPDGCTGISYTYTDESMKEGYAILNFGKLSLKISGKLLTPDDIRCDKIIDFGNKKATDIPIKPDYIHLVEWDESSLSNNQINLLRLKGGATFNCGHEFEIMDGTGSSILLFPSFECSDWKINYAFLIGSARIGGKLHMRLFNITPDSIKELTGQPIKQAEGDITELPITHIALSSDNEELGMIKVKRRKIDPGTATIDISLDFGTSNSILAYRTGLIEAPKELPIKDKTVDILESTSIPEPQIRDSYYWLPTFAPKNENCPVTSIPTEIKCNCAGNITQDNLNSPIKNYSVPSPWYDTLGGTFGKSITNFKWETSNALFNVNTLRHKYLKLIMHTAMATLKEDMSCNNVSFRATYPLAFNAIAYNDLRDLLYVNNNSGLLSELREETGITATPSMTDGRFELISESHAGKANFLVAGYEVVVDIGGGTIDLTLSMGDNIIAVDSIKYGGNVYLDYLARTGIPIRIAVVKGRDPVDLSLQNPDVNEKFYVISNEIRKSGFLHSIASKVELKDQKEHARIIRALMSYFDTIMGYVKILLSVHNISDKITIYPIGNAWQFLFAVPDIGKPDSYIKDFFEEAGISVSVNDKSLKTGKKAVAEGALLIADITSPDLTCPVKTVVGCEGTKVGEATIKKDAEIPLHIDHENTDENNKPIIDTAGFFDTDFFSENYETEESLDTISASFNREIADAIQFRYDGKWYLTRSLYGIFLEKIVPEYFLR